MNPKEIKHIEELSGCLSCEWSVRVEKLCQALRSMQESLDLVLSDESPLSELSKDVVRGFFLVGGFPTQNDDDLLKKIAELNDELMKLNHQDEKLKGACDV